MPWDGEPESDPTQIIIRNLVKEFFDTFSRTLTDDDLRIMMHLDMCRLCQASNLIKHVHDSITSIDRVMGASLRDEFERRIDFLIAHGLISPASGNKVCISHLGKGIVRVFSESDKLPAEKDRPRPRAFIGSSSEGLPIAHKLQFLLQDDLGVSGTRNWVETVDLVIRTTNRPVRGAARWVRSPSGDTS